MFSSLGWGEVLALIVVALFVFGPDRLPKVAKDAGRMLRQLRDMANGARTQLKSELGPEFADLELQDLNPKNFVRKHLLDPMDEDEKSVTEFTDSAAQRLPAGQRPPYDPEST